MEVFVCGAVLDDLGYKTEEVAEEVPVADSAMLGSSTSRWMDTLISRLGRPELLAVESGLLQAS